LDGAFCDRENASLLLSCRRTCSTQAARCQKRIGVSRRTIQPIFNLLTVHAPILYPSEISGVRALTRRLVLPHLHHHIRQHAWKYTMHDPDVSTAGIAHAR